MKILPVDREFGLYVKERDDWTCQRCRTKYSRDAGGSLQTAHFVGRRNYTVRFDPRNADALCAGCHRHFHANPHLHVSWKLAQLGHVEYDKLVFLTNDIIMAKKNRRELPEIAAHFKALRNAIQVARDAKGIVGRMD